MEEIRPQPGPQTLFLSSRADIAIYGGAAGGGKSYALLMEGMRHTSNKDFGGVIFRRTLADVKKQGSLLDTSILLYPIAGAKIRLDSLTWTFPTGAKLGFGHLEHGSTIQDWQGAQIPFIGFDELTHFTAEQFWYMLSRNRSTCGIRPYIRATCNPDADSWVATLLAWWIDQETGLPIPDRAGVLRWFIKLGDKIIWGDSAEQLKALQPDARPKSLTFIPARLEDNAILTVKDPDYRANLMAQQQVHRERLLNGNWKIRPAAGLLFQRHWCGALVDALPADLDFTRGWDLAATEKTETNDPDGTASVKIGRSPLGIYYVADASNLFGAPMAVRLAVLNASSMDGARCKISIPQDPGQSGKAQGQEYASLLAGYNVRISVEARGRQGDPAKVTRFSPFSAQAQAGNVRVLRAPWNEAWFSSLEGFPDARHDDLPDATSRAFNSFHERTPLAFGSL